MAGANIEHTKQKFYCVFELQGAWSWFVCTPADVITLVLPLSSAVDSWLYFSYLQNEGGHSVIWNVFFFIV
jgi:hypothetical protein